VWRSCIDSIPADPDYRLGVSIFNDDRREWCSYSTLSLRRMLEEGRAKRAGKTEEK